MRQSKENKSGNDNVEEVSEINLDLIVISGERGIRTPGTPKGTTDFESAPIDHSGSSPINSFIILK